MPNFIGSATFGSHVAWAKEGNHSSLINAVDVNNSTLSRPATCVVVGIVSPVPLFLEPHGTYNHMFRNGTLETSKLQFQLLTPTLDPDLEADFDLGLNQIEHLQERAIMGGSRPECFVVVHNQTGDGVIKAFEFSWPLFADRVCAHSFLYATLELTLIWNVTIQASPYNRTSSPLYNHAL
jgi:hypothetical protein